MHETGRNVMERDVVPPAFRERVRQGFIGTIIEEAARFGIKMTPAEVEARYPVLDTAPNGSAEPAAPRRGRPPGTSSTASTASSDTKDPAAIVRGINAWNKRVREGKVPASVKAKIAAANGDLSVALKTLPGASASTASAPASTASTPTRRTRRTSGLTSGQRAFETKLERFRAANPKMDEAEARKALMSGASAGRSRAAKKRKTAARRRRAA